MIARMNGEHDFDRLMTAWFEANAQVRAPDQLLDSVITRTRGTRRRPGWLLPERWIPVQLTTRLQPVPRLAPLLLLVALLIAAALAIAIVGSRPRVPAPFGIAGNGRIAYLSNGQIYTSNPDGSDPFRLTSAKSGAATPTWSHDGTRLTYKRLSDNEPADDPTLYGDLVVVKPDGSGEVTIAERMTGLSPGIWSPDDRLIVYSYATAPDFEQVFIAAADGSSPPVQVGDRTTFNWGPTWSPDGTRLSYISDNQVFVINRDGSGRRLLSKGRYAQNSGARWALDGTHLVFSAGEPGQHDLWIVGLDGREEIQLTSEITSEDNPALSPDGSVLAYLQWAAGSDRTRVFVMGADGANPRILDGQYGSLGPVWSPDGTKLVVGDGAFNPPNFFALDATGTSPPTALALPASAQPIGLTNLVEIPDWQRIAP